MPRVCALGDASFKRYLDFGSITILDGNSRRDSRRFDIHKTRRTALIRFAILGAMLSPACTTPGKIAFSPKAHERKYTAQHPSMVRLSDLEASILLATNEFRSKHGLAPLNAEGKLMEIARRHAIAMAKRDKFGDTDKDGRLMNGKDLVARVKDGGYHFTNIAENVSCEHGQHEPAVSVMTSWMDSPPERENLLHPRAVEVGLGAEQGRSGRWYFVQIFGKPLGIHKRAAVRMYAQASVRHF